MSKPLKTKGKCAPLLWAKMSKLEQKVWADLYETFIFDGNFPPEWTEKKQHEQRDVVAHNHACQALWLLKDYIMRR